MLLVLIFHVFLGGYRKIIYLCTIKLLLNIKSTLLWTNYKTSKICGQRVMLDFDLAMLYEVETRSLNQTVKRNIRRFPRDFMFQLTEEEWVFISSQFVMTSRAKRPKKALPYAFTELGALMLSSVLRSSVADETSIKITRAFVAMRQMLSLVLNSTLSVQPLQNCKPSHLIRRLASPSASSNQKTMTIRNYLVIGLCRRDDG